MATGVEARASVTPIEDSIREKVTHVKIVPDSRLPPNSALHTSKYTMILRYTGIMPQ